MGARRLAGGIALMVGALAFAVATGSTARTELRVVQVAAGFSDPVYVTAPRTEQRRLYVVEKPGRIVVMENGKRLSRPFLDIRTLVGSEGSEQGLLSMAFHPRYAKNGRFYVNYTDRQGATRVAEYRARNGRVVAGSRRQLLRVPQPFSNHNGGQLQFGPDGKLYVGMGDGGAGGDPQGNGQNPRSLLAKLRRTDPLRVRWPIAGYGLRNPWRFSFDRSRGDLWIADVGQNEIEEIDYRPRGAPPANYGWARYEGTKSYSSVPLDPPSPVVFPVHEYRHEGGNCSVTGGYVYRGRAVPAAAGRYLFGDYCSGSVWSLRLVEGKATDVRREPFAVASLSSFGEDARGELYLASLDGAIYRLAG